MEHFDQNLYNSLRRRNLLEIFLYLVDGHESGADQTLDKTQTEENLLLTQASRPPTVGTVNTQQTISE